MKKKFAILAIIVAMTTIFVVPVSAADNFDSPYSYGSYEDYKEYVQGLLDDDLITQKGADALLEEYSAAVDNGYGYGACWRYGGGCGGWGRGYGGMRYR